MQKHMHAHAASLGCQDDRPVRFAVLTIPAGVLVMGICQLECDCLVRKCMFFDASACTCTCMQSSIRVSCCWQRHACAEGLSNTHNTCQPASLAGQAIAAEAAGQREAAFEGTEKPCMQMCSRQNLENYRAENNLLAALLLISQKVQGVHAGCQHSNWRRSLFRVMSPCLCTLVFVSQPPDT